MNKIGIFRRLAHHRFCSDEHESTYLAELERIAIERLHNASSAASLVCQHVEIDNSYAANDQAFTPMSGHEQTLSLIVHPEVAGFGSLPAYRAV